MTALAGFWRLDGKPDAAEQCRRVLGAQRIYGDNSIGDWDSGDIAVGRDLFRLLPEDTYDTQPLTGAGERLVLVADVRIDNRHDLTEALALADPGRHSDAAILLQAFERWGESAFDRIVGDFAIAIFDRAERRLLLVRDPLGQRPLHYHRGHRSFAFASMPKGLHALADIPRGPDTDRVAEFVALLPETGSQTCFAGIERVEPGHVVTVTAEGIASRRYWNPTPQTPAIRGAAEWAEALREQLDRAVRARLRGAGKVVATHLSAGLDSSIVTTAAALAMRDTGGRVVAFTSVPFRRSEPYVETDRICDEGPLAALTASQYPNVEHIRIEGDASSPLDLLDRYFFLFEQPMRDLPSGVWFSAIAARAQALGLNVLLPAYMGNLTLSYAGFERLSRHAASGRWLAFAREAGEAVRNGHLTWRRAARHALAPLLPHRMWLRLNAAFGIQLDPAGYSAIHPARLDAIARLGVERRQITALQPSLDVAATQLWALRRIDMGNVNKGTLAGWRLDQRDPLTDRRLVEFCLGVPTEQWFAGGKPRALARAAFEKRVPVAVLEETRRGYQSADWPEGVRGDRDRILEEIERQELGPAEGVIDLPRLRRLAEAWPTSGWDEPAASVAYRQILLRGIAAGHFCRRASGSNA